VGLGVNFLHFHLFFFTERSHFWHWPVGKAIHGRLGCGCAC
jgi:hypothetical protein